MSSEPESDDPMWELMVSSLEPIAPPPEARSRLFASLEGAGRFLPFYADLGRHFDLPRARIGELLSQIDDPAAWTRGLDPLQGHLHFRPGPALPGLHGGLVRLNPGAQFALHRHVDREVTYVLEGAMRDGDGNRFGPGQSIEMAPGSEHALYVDGDEPALIALLSGAIEMLG